MKRVGEEQQAVAGKFLGCEHRGRPSAQRAPAENERLGGELAAGVRSHGGDAFLQARHGVRMTGPFLAVKKVEANDVEPAAEQRLGYREHAAIGHVAASAVRADEERAACRRERRLEYRGGFLFADSDPPRSWGTHGGRRRAIARYFIRSLILARAVRAHSSSNWPPGAPLTPRPPMVVPPAMMAIAPCA